MTALPHSCNPVLKSPRMKTTSSQIHELQSESYPKHVLKDLNQILWALEKMLPFSSPAISQSLSLQME